MNAEGVAVPGPAEFLEAFGAIAALQARTLAFGHLPALVNLPRLA